VRYIENPFYLFSLILIEPIITESQIADYILWKDTWTLQGKDPFKWAAQFEHTILITETGCEILTQLL